MYAPAQGNQYAASGFPALSDAIASGDPREIEHQVAITTFFVRGAIASIKQFGKFIA